MKPNPLIFENESLNVGFSVIFTYFYVSLCEPHFGFVELRDVPPQVLLKYVRTIWLFKCESSIIRYINII